MDVIPVLDVACGVAVRAQGGDRARYEPVVSALVPEAVGDPAALLRAFRRRLGATSCYLADLDAIQGGGVQRALLQELARLETGFAGPLLVDAGAHKLEGAVEVLACGASEVVVGLETLRSFTDLAVIVDAVGTPQVIFSLDLRLGTPILHPVLQNACGTRPSAVSLAAQAVDAGVRSLLVLDLGRVGTGGGADLGLLEELRRRFPAVRLLAGGGVLARRDLDQMRDTGCDAALVASAVHSGAVTAADLAALTQPVVQSPRVSR
jgi:phosphoribosylformimino-5-aminoimidazole carboxamide ribotide isomerase